MSPLFIHELWLVGFLVMIMLFAHFIVYCMGSPLASNPANVDSSAILFFVPYYLARWRMKGNLFDQAVSAWRDQLGFSNDRISAVHALRDHRLNVVIQGRVLFTWERSWLCPVCLHFWLTLIFGVGWCLGNWTFFLEPVDFYIGSLTYLFLHFIIRKL